jgi:hypothetical protein
MMDSEYGPTISFLNMEERDSGGTPDSKMFIFGETVESAHLEKMHEVKNSNPAFGEISGSRI